MSEIEERLKLELFLNHGSVERIVFKRMFGVGTHTKGYKCKDCGEMRAVGFPWRQECQKN